MKFILRLIALVLMLGGWTVAAMCVYVVRVPADGNPGASKFVIVPKNRLSFSNTYVDARHWQAVDVSSHASLIHRVLETGKADQFKFLADPKSKESVESQLQNELNQPAGQTDHHASASAQAALSADSGRFTVDVSY